MARKSFSEWFIHSAPIWVVFLYYEVASVVVFGLGFSFINHSPIHLSVLMGAVLGVSMTGHMARRRRKEHGTVNPGMTMSPLRIALDEGRLPVDIEECRNLSVQIEERRIKLTRGRVTLGVIAAVLVAGSVVVDVSITGHFGLIIVSGIAAVFLVLKIIKANSEIVNLDNLSKRLQNSGWSSR